MSDQVLDANLGSSAGRRPAASSYLDFAWAYWPDPEAVEPSSTSPFTFSIRALSSAFALANASSWARFLAAAASASACSRAASAAAAESWALADWLDEPDDPPACDASSLALRSRLLPSWSRLWARACAAASSPSGGLRPALRSRASLSRAWASASSLSRINSWSRMSRARSKSPRSM